MRWRSWESPLLLIAVPVLLWSATGRTAVTDSTPVDIAAGPPTDISVTVYRAPFRAAGSMTLYNLNGFALIRETRLVHVQPGESRIRFEGVADGIEPVSAIVSGLPGALIERNRDAALLSPKALVAAVSGKALTVTRSNPKTGRTERVPVTVTASVDGVVFQTSEGFEALRCSGLSDSLNFTGTTGLSASPTLSVLVRTSAPSTQAVTLSYLARGFDWSADYSASLSNDGKSLDLGAWVTLANSNGISFPSAHVQVVAGRLNRQSDEVAPFDIGGPLIAMCWPRGSTSDAVQFLQLKSATPLGFDLRTRATSLAAPSPSAMLEQVTVTGARVTQEQLGDLKLYRVPDRTTVASLQSKQVRLLDRQRIPVRRIYTARIQAAQTDEEYQPASVLLRTRNDSANHLGLPLPSGRVAVFGLRGRNSLLLNESSIRDLAVNEEVEIDLGRASDVQVKSMIDETTIDPARAKSIPLLPGVIAIRDAQVDRAMRTEVSNAHGSAIVFELHLILGDGVRVIRADHTMGMKNGQPIFRLTVPANKTVVVRYQTESHTTQGVRE